jgi:hypothetical protein
VQATQTGVLQGDEVVNVDQVVSESHLVLLLGFIEVSVQHLKNSVFGVDFSVVVLLEDLNVFFELLGLC